MLKTLAGTTILTSAAILMTADAAACGESLYHVGKGVTYREYTAPLPAKILMVARTEGELLMAEHLAAAGHDIYVIEDPANISAAVAESGHHFDIVMSLFEQRRTVEEQMRTLAASTVYLPVARDDTPEEAEAKALVRHAPSTADSVKTFLRAIHKTVKQQRRA